ncbi:vWA domain-containing protein [Robertkochia sediminum]|uniref:hypothetical protein n=1 Tax=Robertkochia sediminum TaxID=2785326 RepID=UPI0019315225|nr:hypothetical protein [Robertkochia sediminum]MBL7473551.1 hypothetical protein [Robertkochia sediminum]
MTLLLIVLTFFLAFALSYFWYREKNTSGILFRGLFVLRGLALWALAILLINPLIQKYTYTTEKPNLNVVVDNSSSMVNLGTDEAIRAAIARLQADEDLSDAFNVTYYTLGEDLRVMDSLPAFNESQTDIAGALASLQKVDAGSRTATLLISDGNNTYGADYQYNTPGWKGPVYAVVAGDTTRYDDLSIERVNVNRYAYANNRFPLEVFPVLQGNEDVNTLMEVRRNNKVVYKRNLRLEAGTAGSAEAIELEAGSPGIKRYRVSLSPIEGEKNTTNNSYDFAVEVIGDRNRIAVVTTGSHPDLGALVKILGRQGQRQVRIVRPDEAMEVGDYDLFVLFDPDQSFASLFQRLDQAKKNYWLIAGDATDWNSVNAGQDLFNREITYNSETVQGRVNSGYGEFRFEAPELASAPPINSLLGDFIINTPYDILIYKNINGIETERPLLFTTDNSGRRVAVLDGSGLWKWRLWHFAQNESFVAFDGFWNTLAQYLLTGVQRNRLDLTYKSFYYANSPVTINAGYYDKNFVFDPSENLEIRLSDQDDQSVEVIPMMAETRAYRANLNGLAPGDYRFEVTVTDQGISAKGQFTVLEYDVEKQFVNADVDRMNNLSERTGGAYATLDGLPDIVTGLLKDDTYMPVQKQKAEAVSLVEWPWLLLAICLLFGAEWIIRKYNGLI